MPRSSEVWSAPTAENLAHSRINLGHCAPESVRAIWRAKDGIDLAKALVAHFEGDSQKADDLYAESKIERGGFGHRLRTLHQQKREILNELCGFHGIELLGQHTRSGKSVYYCNTGESYASTLCFMGRRLFVSSWGDLIENKTVKEWQQ